MRSGAWPHAAALMSIMSAGVGWRRSAQMRSIRRADRPGSPAPILSFNTARGVTVAVTGVDDGPPVRPIVAAAKRSLKHIVGKWTVTIGPAKSRGQWRMELRGTAGVHVWFF